VLLGTDYVYPRTTKKILRAFLNAKGMRDDIVETYTPFGHSDLQTIVTEVKEFASQGKQTRFGCVREKGRRENGEGSKIASPLPALVRRNSPEAPHSAPFRPSARRRKRISRLKRLAEGQELSSNPLFVRFKGL
jgi:hypothetical protein